jgi:hypothetical protein
MVNVLVEPLMGDHVGYHILHWIISQSGWWYSKFNENIQQNIRTIESGVAVIDEILTDDEDDFYFFENNERGTNERHYRYYFISNDDNDQLIIGQRRVNDNENRNELLCK